MKQLALILICTMMNIPIWANAESSPRVTGPHKFTFSSQDDGFRCGFVGMRVVPFLDMEAESSIIGVTELSINILSPNNASDYHMVFGYASMSQIRTDHGCDPNYPISVSGTMNGNGLNTGDPATSLPTTSYKLELRIGPDDLYCALDPSTLSGPCKSRYANVSYSGSIKFVPK